MFLRYGVSGYEWCDVTDVLAPSLIRPWYSTHDVKVVSMRSERWRPNSINKWNPWTLGTSGFNSKGVFSKSRKRILESLERGKMRNFVCLFMPICSGTCQCKRMRKSFTNVAKLCALLKACTLEGRQNKNLESIVAFKS